MLEQKKGARSAVTLKDIARAAGVSVTTVSMALRQNPLIREATRQKVLETARQLRYRHNLHARCLRRGKSEQIGLLAFDLGLRSALRKMEAVDRAIWARGYRTLVRNAARHAEMEQEFIKECASNTVDGLVIIQHSPHLTRTALQLLMDLGTPIVTLEPIPDAEIDCVTVDRRYGAWIATRHLLALGHRRIALLHGSLAISTNRQRVEGYADALRECNLPVQEELLIETGPGYDGGYQAAQRALVARPTALFANNDDIAIGAMRALREAGLHVPRDVAVVGFDNLEIAAFAPVPLTTVAQPVEEIAGLAVERLFQQIEKGGEGHTPEIIALKPHLVVRESCGAALQSKEEEG